MENFCITKKCTRYILSSALKTDVFEIPDNKNIGKLFPKYELLFLDQAKSSSDPSEILILQFPIPRALCLSHHLCQILPQPTETPLQHNPHHVLHRFPYFVLPDSTTRYHKYWIYQTIWEAQPIKSIVKLYTDHNTLWVKHATHQKAESLRATSLSKLDNNVNNSSMFNTKYAQYFTKWQVLLVFHSPTCAYNHSYNLHQKSVPLLQSTFTSIFHHYFLTN